MKPSFILSILFCIFALFFSSSAEATFGGIAGTVTDKTTHQPIAGAKIQLQICNFVVATTTTNSQGKYSFSLLLPGRYIVLANASGYQRKEIGAIVFPFSTTTVNFNLVPNAGSLTGKIRSGSSFGPPISGATINVIRGSLIIATTTTNSMGIYNVNNLAPGSYTVVADAPGFQDNKTGAKIKAGQTTTANLVLQPSPGSISGTVTNAQTSAPIQNADISLYEGSIFVAVAFTDSSGNYSFPNLAGGNYSVRCFAFDFQSQTAGATVTPPNNTVVDFALQPSPGTVSGNVINSVTRQPIEGATVSIIRGSLVIAFALTDPNGNYSISGLSPGSYKVFVSADGFQTSSQGASITSSHVTTDNFALNPLFGEISGVVQDNSSQPIEGANIQIFQDSVLIATTLTDSTGNYDVSGLSSGNYTVSASATNFQSQSVGASVVSGQVTTVDFTLVANPGAISGIITDTLSNPIVGARIDVYQKQMLVGSAYTDVSGNYTVSGLPSENYTVNISADGFQSTSTGATVVAPNTTTVSVSLAGSPGNIAGVVVQTSPPQPILGAAIHLFNGPIVIDVALSDSTGAYSFNGVSPGNYSVAAFAQNYQADVVGADVAPNMTTQVNFALTPQPGSVFGTVRDNSNNPIPGVNVSVYRGTIFVASTLTDNNGQYSIANLSPGSYNLVFIANGFQDIMASVIITSNNASELDIFMPSSPGSITGTVTDISGPVANATMTVYRGSFIVESTLTDMSGQYTFSNLSPGPYNVVADATGHQTAIAPVNVSMGGTVTLDFFLLQNPGAIVGTVTDATSHLPIEGVTIYIYNGSTLITSGLTNSQGQYSFPDLAPGDYTVVATIDSYQTAHVGATVTSNNTTTANFSLSKNPGSLAGTVNDANGQFGLFGASVDVYDGFSLVASALTGPGGTYQIDNLAPGNYSVVAHSPGYSAENLPATITSGATTQLNFNLFQNQGFLQGTVKDNLSNPLPGATVTVYLNNVLIESTITDSNGNYNFNDLAPNTYTVTADAPGFAVSFATVTISTGNITTQDFVLSLNQGSLSGVVTNGGNGSGIPGAQVSIYSGSMIIASTVTDNNGNYSINGLPPGTYTALAEADNFTSASAIVTIVLSMNTVQNFSLIPLPLNPASAKGQSIRNKFLTQTDRVNIITWTPSPSSFITEYRVYRDGVFVKSVPANGELIYEDHNNKKGTTVTYTIVAVNSFGYTSSGLTIKVKVK